MSITPVEVAVLQTVLNKVLATVADVAVGTKVSTARAKELLDDLKKKQLVKDVEPGGIKVTDEGRFAVRNMGRCISDVPQAPMDAHELESDFEEALSKLPG